MAGHSLNGREYLADNPEAGHRPGSSARLPTPVRSFRFTTTAGRFFHTVFRVRSGDFCTLRRYMFREANEKFGGRDAVPAH